MKIDKDRILTYISEISTAIENLRNYSKLDKQKFLSSQVTIRDTKYCFIIASQAAIDLCYYLNAKLTKKAPTDYSNCFKLLEETTLFSNEVLNKMALMAKFRNLLVHHYVKVDDERVYEKLKEIDCFENFIKDLKAITKN